MVCCAAHAAGFLNYYTTDEFLKLKMHQNSFSCAAPHHQLQAASKNFPVLSFTWVCETFLIWSLKQYILFSAGLWGGGAEDAAASGPFVK